MRPLIAVLALAAACAPAATFAPAPRTAGLEAELRRMVAGAGASTEVSVAFRDLATGDSVLLDADRSMHAASTMKVPVMLELFRRADAGELRMDQPVELRNTFRSIADGSTYSLGSASDSDSTLYRRLGERVPLRTLVEAMITRSSNLATNLLIDLAEPRRIAVTLDGLGARGVRVLRGVEDGPAYAAGMNNTTTAHGLMRVMEGIASGRAASPAATREMLAILGRQEFREMIPAGLPAGVRSANKTGNITAIAHDAAIVFPEGREPYVLVVLTRGFRRGDDAASVARDISRAVYRHVTAPR
ncbi:MAG TPA: serine hydrolase [Longimicrobium sp.]|nr:serine hydrolase [Longimicrobium sp.]